MYSDYTDDDEEMFAMKPRIKRDFTDDDDDDDSENEEESSSSSELVRYESDRGSDGEEETDYDEENPYDPPPPTPPRLPKRRKRRRNYNDEQFDQIPTSNEPDRISSLPESVLIHILSFLPIKDAVRTGALSQNWIHLWKNIENVSFIFSSTFNSIDDEDRVQSFIHFVDRTLVSIANSKIKRFSFEFSYERRFVSNFNVWVRFMVLKNIPELDLNLYTPRPGNRYLLPQCAYEKSDLVKFTVSKCKILPRRVDWRSLRVLTIKCAELTGAVMRKIVKGSPLLESLELYRCWFYPGDDYGPYNFTIDSVSLKKLVIWGYRHPGYDSDYYDDELIIFAPNILSLEMKGHLGIRKIQLMNVSSLVDAKLDYNQKEYRKSDFLNQIQKENREYDFKENLDMLKGFLTSLEHVEYLTLGSFCIQVLSILELKGFPSQLLACKSLKIETRMDKWYLPGIIRALRSSPDVESLLINLVSEWYEFRFGSPFCTTYNFDGEEYWESQKGAFECSLLHLKTVKVVGMNKENSKSELEIALALLRFLLENSSLLEKMVISVGMFKLEPEFLEFSQRLSSFKKSSPNLVIMFP